MIRKVRDFKKRKTKISSIREERWEHNISNKLLGWGIEWSVSGTPKALCRSLAPIESAGVGMESKKFKRCLQASLAQRMAKIKISL